MAGRFWNIRGTVEALFRLGIGGPQLKASAGAVEHRDSADAAFAVARGADPVGADDLVTKRYYETQHKALRDLIHFIDDGPADGFLSGAVKDTTFSGAFPTSEVWYEDATKTQKIVELLVTYTGALPTTEVWKMYDTDGTTVLVTLTDAIAYSGVFETTRTRTWV